MGPGHLCLPAASRALCFIPTWGPIPGSAWVPGTWRPGPRSPSGSPAELMAFLSQGTRLWRKVLSVISSPRRHVAVCGDIFDCHTGWDLWLNNLQCMRQPPAQNDSDTGTCPGEKPLRAQQALTASCPIGAPTRPRRPFYLFLVRKLRLRDLARVTGLGVTKLCVGLLGRRTPGPESRLALHSRCSDAGISGKGRRETVVSLHVISHTPLLWVTGPWIWVC